MGANCVTEYHFIYSTISIETPVQYVNTAALYLAAITSCATPISTSLILYLNVNLSKSKYMSIVSPTSHLFPYSFPTLIPNLLINAALFTINPYPCLKSMFPIESSLVC
eukprot:555222_1